VIYPGWSIAGIARVMTRACLRISSWSNSQVQAILIIVTVEIYIKPEYKRNVRRNKILPGKADHYMGPVLVKMNERSASGTNK
jgi:hypothetical protein